MEQWSRFWRQGFITTFGVGKAANYEGAVREFWVKCFAELPEGARILDIATGNGAIATIAAEISEAQHKDFFLAATDLAEIHQAVKGGSQLSRLRNRIHFHSHTPCEQQPFADDSFDCVTSQVGFEYSDVRMTLAEVRRILAPGGQFRAISHHADSRLIRRTLEELEVYRTALEELALFQGMKDYLAAAGDLSGTAAQVARALEKARPLSQEFNSLMESFRKRHGDQECAAEMVGAIGQLARSARSVRLEELLARVDDSEREFRLARDRLVDMTRAAFGKQEIRALETAAEDRGFGTFECRAFRSEDGQLAGWQIHMR
jgi:ubiquinone/menaquinone biosynthesis C-methylase UbiE